ncbi:amidase [Paenibacillus sp. J31TS4]|uniref:N-acetylmuramoyl-L-alanine amidase n=1 Tax=Paenibacillus sp. J31TS4 TaxID=2807195 RepID=UPI001B02F98B|nr:peptidoglycan recognition family protein [Paenibacillus sp. J31TS4]GIP37795.1 amidase [Paenibacillus sp. J31TS4]
MSIRLSKRRNRMLLTAFTAGILTVTSSLSALPSRAAPPATGTDSPLQQAFESASLEFGVPLEVLMSVAYNETRWESHGGEPSMGAGYGVMHLTQANEHLSAHSKGDAEEPDYDRVNDPALRTLDTAAALLGVSPDALKLDTEQNIRGGAALLASYARELHGSLPATASDWYAAVAKYSGSDAQELAQSFADDVYATMLQGVEAVTTDGQYAKLNASAVVPNTSLLDTLHLRSAQKSGADCPNGLACRYIPAAYSLYSGSATDYGNYDLANRTENGDLKIKYIVIHDVEGSYKSAINTFLSKSYVSAHYVIDSTTGEVTQMVRPKDVAWQAGNWYINAHSIGIEHSGFAAEGGKWYSEQMYHASARLVKYLAKQYDIPLDRQHILGHDELPGLAPANQTGMHWDPGAYWDWAHYFTLLGEPFESGKKDKKSGIVTINGNFKQNMPPLEYGGKPLEPQPVSFLPLYSAPSFDAPLLSDPALHPDGSPGTIKINDWGDKAVFGQSYYQADEQGDWTAIYFGGQKAWFHNPKGKNTVPGSGMLVTPKKGAASIPVYGAAFPEPAAYTKAGIPVRNRMALQYTIPAGQKYVATGPIKSTEYYAKLYNAPETYKVIQGEEEFYQISFNHRIAFVKKSDVDVVDPSGK